jgi:hypothetical protein
MAEISNGDRILQMLDDRLGKTERIVEAGFLEARHDLRDLRTDVQAQNVRLSLIERQVETLPCDGRYEVMDSMHKEIDQLWDQVKNKLTVRPLLIAVAVGVVSVLISKLGIEWLS